MRRPVAVSMVYAVFALLGVAAWRNLPVELLPNTELPRLTVTAAWPGASPETVEAFLTAPLEAVLQQVRGVGRIESVSEESSARVSLEFGADVDMQFVRLEMSERLATLERDLPQGVRGPWVQAYVPEEFREQSRSFMRYTVTGPYTLETLRALVDTAIAPALREIDGVAEVVAAGGRRRLLEIGLDDARMLALGIAPERVRAAVALLELTQEGGAVDVAGVRRPVAIREDIESIDEVLSAVVLADGRRVVRLRDFATVHDTYEEATSHYRVDGRFAVSFEVFRAVGSNAVRVADAVRASLAAPDPPLPAGVRLILDEDQSDAIRAQLSDLRFRAIIAAGVIFLVLLLFLKSVRSTAIVFGTIGFSVLITLNLVHFGGMSLNMLTLMGLALGFGLIVDNAIVVLENVHARWRRGDAPAVAAERGAREVVLPVLAATATTIIVVVPFIWHQGELRAYYVPLGVVVAFSLIASLFVAFTFIPAVAARLLDSSDPAVGARDGASVGDRATAAGDSIDAERPMPGAWYLRAYGVLVRTSVRRPWLPIVLGLLALAGSYYLFDKHVPRGVLWTSWWNERTYIRIQIGLPRGAEIERTDQYARFFEERLRAMPEVGRFTTHVGPTNASIQVSFPDSLAQTSVPVVIKEQLLAYSHLFGGAEVRVYGFGPSFYGGGSSPPNYSIEVLGYNYEMVRDIAEDLGARLRRFSRVRDVDTNSWGRWYERDRATEVVLRLDRGRLVLHGLSARDVVAYVGTAVGGSTRGDVIQVAGEERVFRVKLGGSREMDVLALVQLLVPTPGGGVVRLGEVASLAERDVMSRIVREDQQYQRLVSYEFRGPQKLGDRYHEAVMAATALPAGFVIETGEGWSWDEEERRQIWIVIAAALILVFMTTAALFESLRQPFIVLLSVPMALIGVFLIFWLTGASFTREAYVGVIMMGGIVVNNAILLVDHVNRLAREQDVPMGEAVVQGALDRVRPILMTSATTVLGLLPLVLFSESADANIWNALGYALIGGLTSATLLVLTVTPALLVLTSRPR
ncbi:MAG TPA: efflux RND transporter permease subunit [Longimicrobiales bacterium]|nr:efflux RND transporter permease subunit [Longimicrobiales bacterium]